MSLDTARSEARTLTIAVGAGLAAGAVMAVCFYVPALNAAAHLAGPWVAIGVLAERAGAWPRSVGHSLWSSGGSLALIAGDALVYWQHRGLVFPVAVGRALDLVLALLVLRVVPPPAVSRSSPQPASSSCPRRPPSSPSTSSEVSGSGCARAGSWRAS